MGAGRPKKYTRKGLEKAVEGYFASISRDAGGEAWAAEYKRPPTVGGLGKKVAEELERSREKK